MSEPSRLLIDENVSSAPASPGHLVPNSTTVKAGMDYSTAPKMATMQNCPATNGACLDTSMNMSMDTSVNLSPKEKEKRKVNRITEYIEDQKDRIRSYFRRRHVPLKRAFDMDLQCGTQTFLIQISDDIEECLYYGNDKLVQKFLSEQGLSLANVNDFIANEKKKFGNFVEEDPDLLESLGKSSKRRKSTHKNLAPIDEDDDDFSPTVKERDRKRAEKRREAAKRVQEGDYLSNINERSKVFRSRREGLIGKIGDTDSVCGTKTFLVVINMDQEAAFYHGDTGLVSQFFSTGISKKSSIDKN